MNLQDTSMFQCPKCFKRYNRRDSMIRHKNYECGTLLPKFKCLVCHKGFKRSDHCKSHLKMVHYLQINDLNVIRIKVTEQDSVAI